jgi:alginate O-acetyltransferase complex protein AlgI
LSFDSVTFAIFFAVAWAAWRLLPFGAAKTATVFLSLFFYGWWDAWYVSLIVFSSVLDYVAGARIHAAPTRRARRRWLLASLVGNLGVLAVFKYAPFAAENASALAALVGADLGWRLPDWVIPVGISFYTFQTLSYSIDVYRGQLEPVRSFRDFVLYVSFFPQLVAGPIVRARELLPQFVARRPLRAPTVQAGLYHVALGLFLKVVVADNLAPVVENAFAAGAAAGLAPASAWLAVVYFSIQIFADFAGYSGIAIGIAYLMGLRFPENFRYPYISRGLSEFWTRWHISLSSWLRDYLYVSLGGNRKGRAKTYAFLMVTMLLGGLWHGAAWTFVAWGGLHGLGLCVERAVRGRGRKPGPLDRPGGPLDVGARVLQIGVVYVFVLTTWVFFRAEDFPTAQAMLARMYVAPFREPFGFEVLGEARHLVLVLPVALLHLGQLAREWYGARPTPVLRAVTTAVLLFLLTVVRRDAPSEFIYFQF